MSAVIQFPQTNVFPSKKWREYVSKTETLGNLRSTRREIDRSIKLVRRDVEKLRRELVDALEAGAAIEHAGRIAG